MKAKFIKKYIWSILCLLCGLFVTVILTICVFKGDYDAIIGVVFVAIYTIGSAISLFFNHKAYLCVEDGYIKGKYHLFGKINAPVSDIDFVLTDLNALTIQLKNGKIHRILRVEDPWNFCAKLRRQISYEENKSIDELIADLEKHESDKKKSIIYLCVACGLMLLNIVITALLTGARDFANFSNIDWIVFSCFCVTEVIIYIIICYIASKAGKQAFFVNKAKYSIRRKAIEMSPLLPGNPIKVATDDDYYQRYTFFGYPNEDSVYITIEDFDANYSMFKTQESEIFEDMEHIPEVFEHMIDISDEFAL